MFELRTSKIFVLPDGKHVVSTLKQRHIDTGTDHSLQDPDGSSAKVSLQTDLKEVDEKNVIEVPRTITLLGGVSFIVGTIIGKLL